jgi:AmmeMemoRadiSam system protein B
MPAIRPAAVAGMFYPDARARLAADVQHYLAAAEPSTGAAPKVSSIARRR